MRAYVVDASVAVKWFFREVHRDAALRVLSNEPPLRAPDFLLLETDNVFCTRVRQGDITREQGERMRAAMRSYAIRYVGQASLLDRAYRIATSTGRSAYDCLYVALAVDLGGQVVTADRRLYNGLAATAYADHVAWVEDVGGAETQPKRRDAKGKRRRSR